MLRKSVKASISFILVLLFAAHASAETVLKPDSAIKVPVGGNGWLNKGARAVIGDKGLSGWSAKGDTLSVYVYLQAAGSLDISVRLLVPDGQSKLMLIAGKQRFIKTVRGKDTTVVNFGKIAVVQPGYRRLKLVGLFKTGTVFADVSDFVLSGTALLKGAAYVKNNEGNYYYWGHRGPSVHLSYKVPAGTTGKVEWFYNEVTVKPGDDVIGSYFMADGFSVGYFGMQVNSATERRLLFSVWSPFSTDDKNKVPDSLKIKMLTKGALVHSGEFGGEGSGGQSYLVYPWKAGKTYCFLMHAEPDAATRTTIFTAYFKEKAESAWQPMASFRRPQTVTYLKGLHSFLENFEPEMGNVTRKVFFGNEWMVDDSGKWFPVTDAVFTGDATANINYRKDYSGGVKGNLFYLRNCGFFDDFTKLKTNLTRQSGSEKHPDIEWKLLP
ncbi:DUF3472 domain-containing protein [uncultured Mucilaginibacter sp.]|uniref:DUF3472 domain-containing protein n=1 Tax=uncultured Mucilaginibacter sp. TaxID=797541 RepID=UPI0025D0FE07|nr:DUF3472 domain-containing protein [uncultured Mucilaginibacter sp.]